MDFNANLCNDTLEFTFNIHTMTATCVSEKGHDGNHCDTRLRTQWTNVNAKPVVPHKFDRTRGPQHDWDCLACVNESIERTERRKNENPHRLGTKANAKWDVDRSRSDWAMDQRSETYWSI